MPGPVLRYTAIVLAIALPAIAIAQQPGQPPHAAVAPEQRAPAVMNRDEIRASRLIGKTLQSQARQDLGEIDELIIGPEGRIDAVVVAVGGFLGLGEKHVAIPFEQLQVAADGSVLVEWSRQQLESAPEYHYKERGQSG